MAEIAGQSYQKPMTQEGKHQNIEQAPMSLSQPMAQNTKTPSNDLKGKNMPQAPPMTFKAKTKTKMGSLITQPVSKKPKVLEAKRMTAGSNTSTIVRKQQHQRQSSVAIGESAQRNPSTNIPNISSAKNSTSSLIFVPRGSQNISNKAEIGKKYATATSEVAPNLMKGKHHEDSKKPLAKLNTA